jgi:hypothetical protein
MDPVAEACELYRDGFWGQPANSVTSLAFVVAAVAILAGGHRDRSRVTFAALVAAVGVGSLIQHGPNPDWQAYAHDLPMAALFAFVAVDAASDLTGRRFSSWWWIAPIFAMIPIVTLGWLASAVAQTTLAVIAIGLNLLRAYRRPQLRSRVLSALAIFGVAGLIGTLSERTTLCQPDSLLQGHAVWHILTAVALWWIAPVIARSSQPAHADARSR